MSIPRLTAGGRQRAPGRSHRWWPVSSAIINPRSTIRNRAFTLIEVLVVIGIIALLIGLLTPLVYRSLAQSRILRTKADFQTISVALEAYKQDFGDYPRIPTDANGNPVPDTGAAILGKALLGPYGDGLLPSGVVDTADPPVYQSTIPYHPGDCVMQGGYPYVCLAERPPEGFNNAYWAKFEPRDGADGPGFRTRGLQGKIWGPYLQPGKINSNHTYLLDHRGGPILYFPARPAHSLLTASATPQPYVDQSPQSLFNANDNLNSFRRDPGEYPAGGANDQPVLNRIRLALGDYDCNGYISNGETAVTLPYLLISPGGDGLFGPADGLNGSGSNTYTPNPADPATNRQAQSRCDDVTNIP